MILNRTGAEFAYEGVTYTIGGAIVGTAESEYAGLYGRINAIHDGEDKETENETPDIYCEFDPPVMPHEVKVLEDTFSDLYHQPKTIADIVLDMVIMAPEMIRPLDDLRSMRKRVNVFLVMEDWAVNGEHGNDCEAFSDYDDAKRVMTDRIREELEDGSVPSWRESSIGVTSPAFCKYQKTYCKKPEETPYTVKGRAIHWERTRKKMTLPRMEEILTSSTLGMLIAYGKTKPIYNLEYFLNRMYALNRDKMRCRICGKPIVDGDDYHAHHIRKNLPLSEINRVSNLASTHRSCHKLVHGQKSKDGFSPKAVRQAEKYRKKLLS